MERFKETKIKTMRCSDTEAVAAYRRVLKLVNGYIAKNLDQEQLVTYAGGLMTWREIRYHIRSSIAMRHPMLRRGYSNAKEKVRRP